MNLSGWVWAIIIVFLFAAIILFSFVTRLKTEKKAQEEYKKNGSDSLVKILSDKKSRMREQAAKTLGENREKDAIQTLVNIIHEEEDAELLVQAAEALIKIDDEKTADLLIDEANFADPANKWYACYVIEKLAEKGIKNTSAIGFLISVMTDRKKLLGMGMPYDSAYEALKKTTGQDFGKEASKWKEWWNSKS